jgi:hypothetical protein
MFWVTAFMKPCRFVGNYESLTGTCCIHLHGRAERRKDFSETLATPATRGHSKVTYVHHLRRHKSLRDVIIFFSSTFCNETFFLARYNSNMFASSQFRSRYSDSLRAGRSGNRIPVGSRFSTPIQTGPGPHSASYTMGTGSFPGLKRPGPGVDHIPASSTEVDERVELNLYSHSGPSWHVLR